MDPELLLTIRAFLAECQIELAERRASAKQRSFQTAFFNRTHRIYVAMGGNRSGKTMVAGRLCFAKYLRDIARDGDAFWCVAPNFDKSVGAAGGQQKELWQALPRWMFKEQVWNEKTGFTHRKIVLPTRDGGQCVVEFRSADQAAVTFETGKLTGIWVDERLPEVIYDRLLPRIIDRSGWILYSDIPEQFWHIERLKEALPAARIYWQHFRMWDNAHNLPDGAIEEASAQMSSDNRKLRIEGEFIVMEGIVYKEYLDVLKPTGHLCRWFPIPASWQRWRLIDYGGSAPTACLWMAIAPNEHAYCYREYYEAGLAVGVNAKAILELSGNESYRATFIDPHAYDPPPVYYGAAKTIAEQYAENGIHVTGGWPYVNVMGEHAMVQRVKYRWETRTLWVMETLTNLRRELRSWKYKLDKDGKPLAADAFEDGNNHLLDDLKGFFGTNPCYAARLIEH